jgi:hypothetical protein
MPFSTTGSWNSLRNSYPSIFGTSFKNHQKEEMGLLGRDNSDAVQGASEICDQAVHASTAREQISRATKKYAEFSRPTF